ncbi:hypothetical protein PIROE2DRAFT_3493 [Piromyces sp. E2]|nr:hypothetical protein PIROE2DRAFT_3493 [Piromyces sp. E2]|eukprot:OUM68794.1 hypothetical protein PIROE2DRAFT_3493 [Piromyces sp. E2]
MIRKLEGKFEQAYKKCNESTIAYDSCFPVVTPNIKDLDELCIEYNSLKCQEYAKNGLDMIPGCQIDELKDFIKMYNNLIHYLSFNFKLTCATDENGNYCPYNSEILTEMKNSYGNISNNQQQQQQQQHMEIKEKQYYQNTQKTCNSKKCIDAYIDYYTNRYKESENFFENVIKNPNNVYNDIMNSNYNPTNQVYYNATTKNFKNRNSKRSFSIENYKNHDIDKYINETITFLQSDECQNVYKSNLQKEIEDTEDTEISSSNIIQNNIQTVIGIIFLLCILF